MIFFFGRNFNSVIPLTQAMCLHISEISDRTLHTRHNGKGCIEFGRVESPNAAASNYSDLTRPISPKRFARKGNPLISENIGW